MILSCIVLYIVSYRPGVLVNYMSNTFELTYYIGLSNMSMRCGTELIIQFITMEN